MADFSGKSPHFLFNSLISFIVAKGKRNTFLHSSLLHYLFASFERLGVAY